MYEFSSITSRKVVFASNPEVIQEQNDVAGKSMKLLVSLSTVRVWTGVNFYLF